MSLNELLTAHTNYEVRLRDHLNGRGPELSATEKTHAYEVEGEYAAWKEALRWSYARP